MEYAKGGQCSGRVDEGSGWGRTYQCTRRAVVERDGKPYCKIHDPKYIKAKEKDKQEKWDKEWAEERAYRELQNTAVRVCKKINPDNPLAVAEGIGDLYEACKAVDDYLNAGYPDNLKLKKVMFELVEQALAKVKKD